MKEKLLQEIKRMRELAGLVPVDDKILKEQHFTRKELMQQEEPSDFESLIDADLNAEGQTETEDEITGTHDPEIKAPKDYQTQPYSVIDASPEIPDPGLDTPAELDLHAKDTLYPGQYKGMYAGEHMMEEDYISKLNDDDVLLIDNSLFS